MKLIKNLFLIVALSAVIIMVIAIFLYDYMPNSVTVSKANTYETSSSTTKVLAAITEESELLNQSTSNETPTPALVLKELQITSKDLSVYKSMGEYENGRANPLEELGKDDYNTGSDNDGNETGNSNLSDNQVNDGTLFNSSYSK